MRKTYSAALRVAGILVLISQVFINAALLGQTVWPGDINNNGVVNGVDLLYHAVAEGNSGPTRLEVSTDWTAHNASIPWSGTFADGINYRAADADGQGSVDHNDRKTLWEDNYGNTHGNVIADVYPAGNPQLDPMLWLEATQGTVNARQALELDVFLGDANKPVDNFFGITFTLSFDADYVKDETTAPLWNPNKVSFTLNENTWLNGTGSNAAEAFVRLDNEAGELEVVILRNEYGTVSGHGEIASVMVIIEDVVFLQDVNTPITISKIKMIDDDLQEYPIAGSTENVTILESQWANMLVGDQTNTEQTGALGRNGGTEQATNSTASEDLVTSESEREAVEIRVYPNPVVEKVYVESKAGDELEAVRLFSGQGQLMQAQELNAASSTELDLIDLPAGNYFLQLTTTNGTTVKQITK